jgi:single-stranded-DNA-specific exonuclease
MSEPALISVTGKTWQLRSCDARQALALAQRLNVPESVGRILAIRGIPLELADSFLHPRLREQLPDPLHLRDMDKAVARIAAAILQGERIAVFGDYDVDGATSSALLKRYCKALGVPLDVYIPDRIQEGYGVNATALTHLKGRGVQVVITVDCGITAFEPLRVAQALGLDVVVLDHHTSEPELPPAVALVNPNRLDEDSEYGYLAAVGVTFLFLVALNRELAAVGFFKTRAKPDLLDFLDIVALGTVCDVVPLVGLNRAFVAQGLKVLAGRRNVGLRALADTARIDDTPGAYHLGFVLGPRINAGGRVGKADLGTLLLATDDPVFAAQVARELDVFNQERKAIEDSVLDAALAQAETLESAAAVVTWGENWHPGVIGIVAGRLKERFHRPACVIGVDGMGIGKGSGRSITGVHLGNLVIAARQQGMLLAGGGHGMAAGFTVAAPEIAGFARYLEEQVGAVVTAQNLKPTLMLDAEITVAGCTPSLISALDMLGPFGAGNPQPRLWLPRVRLVQADIVGKDHVRCVVSAESGTARLKAIAFRVLGSPLGELLLGAQGQVLHLAGTLKLDTWGGNVRAQLMIEDGALARDGIGAVPVAA